MALLFPLALGLTALGVPILLMHLRRTRHRERVTSSLVMWRRVAQESSPRTSRPRLLVNPLLLLQLLALLILVLALAQPAYTHADAVTGDVILIVDQSYGMQARDVAPSRFAEAMRRADRLARDVGPGSVVSVIGMGAQPHLAVAESGDQSTVERAIGGLRPGLTVPNATAALSLAESLVRDAQKTRIVILTSRESAVRRLPPGLVVPVEIQRIGGTTHDLGITAFQASRAGASTQAIVRIKNFGPERVVSDLRLFVSGRLADVQPLDVTRGREVALRWTHLPGGIQRLKAHVTVQDDMPIDKTAWAVVARASSKRVLLVSNGGYFLQAALKLDPAVALSRVSPLDYSPAVARAFDLIVFDGVLPHRLPDQSALLVAPPKGGVGQISFGARAPVDTGPAGQSGDTASSMLHYVDLGDVHVARARALVLPEWMQPVVVAGQFTLVAAGDDGARRVAVIPFDFQESDWPLRVSFPIFVQNLLHYLVPGLTLGETGLTAGDPLRLFPVAGTREILITRPDGRVRHVRPPFAPFTDTGRPGLYRARAAGSGSARSAAPAPFAVNFFPARLPSVRGPDVQHIGRRYTDAERRAIAPTGVTWAFSIVALGVLSAEWWLACRR